MNTYSTCEVGRLTKMSPSWVVKMSKRYNLKPIGKKGVTQKYTKKDVVFLNELKIAMAKKVYFKLI